MSAFDTKQERHDKQDKLEQSVAEILIAIKGDESLGIDGLASQVDTVRKNQQLNHDRIIKRLDSLEREKLFQRGWAAGAGAVSAGIIAFVAWLLSPHK